MPEPWQWDETLFRGSARYYAGGRFPYPPELAAALQVELELDGTGRLLDVGCGPGSLTLLLAPLFAEAVGVDADADMIAAAAARSEEADSANVRWVRLRAEELPAGLGRFDVATFAQSFHWMDRLRVAATVRDMLPPGGAWVHVHATTHRGVGGSTGAGLPEPPHDGIDELVARYLGPVRRAGLSLLPDGTARYEEQIMVDAGFSGPTRLTVPGRLVDRTEDEVVAAVFSRSLSAPHLFGERLGQFEAELRELLRESAPDGRFRELAREIDLVVWRS